MFRKLAAAAIAVTLIAGPAFAQGNTTATTTPKAAVTTGVKANEAGAVTAKNRKHVSMNLRHRHHVVRHAVHMKRAKHVVHAKQLKHGKQVTRSNAPVKAKISG